MSPTPHAQIDELLSAIQRRQTLQREAADQGRQDEWQHHYNRIRQTLLDPDRARDAGDEVVRLQGTNGSVRLWVSPPLTVCFAIPADQPVVWVHDYGSVPPWPNAGPPPPLVQFDWLLGGHADFNRIRRRALAFGQEAEFLAAYNQTVLHTRLPEEAIHSGELLRLLRHRQAQIRVVVQGFLWVYYIVYPIERIGFFFHFDAPDWPEGAD